MKVDVGPGLTSVFLHGDDVDLKTALAELLLQLLIGVLGDGLVENLDRIFEVVQVLVCASSLQHVPGLGLSLVSNVGVVQGLLVLALECFMTFLKAVLADLGLRRTIATGVT